MNEEELKNVNEWIKECDVDGRMLNFEFFDTDIEDLKNAVKRDFQKGKLEAIEDELRFLREIEKGTSCIDTKMFLKLRIEQLQKEIGEEIECLK